MSPHTHLTGRICEGAGAEESAEREPVNLYVFSCKHLNTCTNIGLFGCRSSLELLELESGGGTTINQALALALATVSIAAKDASSQ